MNPHRESGQVGHQQQPAVGAHVVVRGGLPLERCPKGHSRKEARHSVHLTLYGAVPKRVRPREGQGAHEARAEHRDVLAEGFLAAHQFFGKHGDGPKQEGDREGRRQSARKVDPVGLACHVAQCELRHHVRNELKDRGTRRVSDLKLDRGSDVFTTVPEAYGGLKGECVGNEGDDEGRPAEGVVPETVVVHCCSR